jgi:hypothetical protein
MGMNGVVMKITKDRIVILCEDGSFRNIAFADRSVALGERIEVPAASAAPSRVQSRFAAFKRIAESLMKLTFLQRLKAGGMTPLKRGFIGASAAAVFMLVVGLAFILRPDAVSAEPVALVAVDINPSIELYVDADGKVNKAALVNDDAKWLIGEDELRGEDLYLALERIIKKAEEQGYLNTQTEKTFVLLSVIDLGKTAFQVDTAKIAMPSDQYSVQLYYVDQQEREKAQETGLTVNKYVVMEQAKELGVELDAEQLKTHSVVNALSSVGVSPKEFFKENKASDKYKQKQDKVEVKQTISATNDPNSGNPKHDEKSGGNANGQRDDKQQGQNDDKKGDKQTGKQSDEKNSNNNGQDKNKDSEKDKKYGDINKNDSDRNKSRDNERDHNRNNDRNDGGKGGNKDDQQNGSDKHGD